MVAARWSGSLINVILWLSATWHIHPYFLGSDSIYAVAWLALLAGALEAERSRFPGRMPSLAERVDHVGRREVLRGGLIAGASVGLAVLGSTLAGAATTTVTGLGRGAARAQAGPGSAAGAGTTQGARPPPRDPRRSLRRVDRHHTGAGRPGRVLTTLDQLPVGAAVGFTAAGGCRPRSCASPTGGSSRTAGSARTRAARSATTHGAPPGVPVPRGRVRPGEARAAAAREPHQHAPAVHPRGRRSGQRAGDLAAVAAAECGRPPGSEPSTPGRPAHTFGSVRPYPSRHDGRPPDELQPRRRVRVQARPRRARRGPGRPLAARRCRATSSCRPTPATTRRSGASTTDRALVATLDYFTPIVDDPYDWGRIAATNAMSDVYAMGGAPFLGLNIANWPVDDLPLEMLGQVLQGGIDAAAKAGRGGDRRPFDHRPRAEVRDGGARLRRTPTGCCTNAAAPPGRSPLPHEAARARDDLHRA